MLKSVRQLSLALCVALASCAAKPTGRADLFDFLNDGTTRRDDVYLKLGEPSAKYEDSTIFAYRLVKDQGGYVLLNPGSSRWRVQYNLILVFDPIGVLRRHSIVEVRAQ